MKHVQKPHIRIYHVVVLLTIIYNISHLYLVNLRRTQVADKKIIPENNKSIRFYLVEGVEYVI